MNAISPAHLTAAERLDELCAILARGVVRLRARAAAPAPAHHDVGRDTVADRQRGLGRG